MSTCAITTALFPNSPSVPIATPFPFIGDLGENVWSLGDNVLATSFQWGAQFGRDIITGRTLFAYFQAYRNVPLSIWIQFAFAHSVRILFIWSLLSLGLWLYRRTPKTLVATVAELYASTFVYSLAIFVVLFFPAFAIAISTIALTIKGAVKLWKPVTDEIVKTVALLRDVEAAEAVQAVAQ
ncbi:hypothetical protein GGR51DRAFT_577211 [Nemania sp. FL0031]|nr:hypothetical protein GGR51DRAFT_577211 [Nemania sp. FL0031]